MAQGWLSIHWFANTDTNEKDILKTLSIDEEDNDGIDIDNDDDIDIRNDDDIDKIDFEKHA